MYEYGKVKELAMTKRLGIERGKENHPAIARDISILVSTPALSFSLSVLLLSP
jgi:hypothetical protein